MLPNAARQIAAAAEGRGDAMRPFIGAVEGEGAPRAQFIRGKDRNKTRAELQSQFGEEQGGIAYEVERVISGMKSVSATLHRLMSLLHSSEQLMPGSK